MAKKLTKAQIKAKLKQIHKLLFIVERDRMEHINANSFGIITLAKLMDVSDIITRALKKF